jgi:hypothetical protein
MSLRPVGIAAARVGALHWSASSRGYKLTRKRADPRSLGWCVCVHLISEVISFPPPRCGLCLPFYSSQEEGSGYICGKKVKWRKDEREKTKKVASGAAVFLLIRCEQFTL